MKTKIIFIVFLFSASISFAQKRTVVADKFFDNYAYLKASEFYQKAYDKGNDSEHVLTRLGDCYYNNSNSEKAAYWYKLALDKYPKLSSDYVYKYVQTQLGLKNYEEADKWLKNLNDDKRKDSELIKSLISTEETYVNINNLDSNSEFSDFGAFQYNDKIIFASSRNLNPETNRKKVYSWNNEPYLDLYQADINETNQVSNITTINSDIVNTKYHEASAVITNDGKTLYFTRDNVNKRNRIRYDDQGTTHLKLYKATLENGKWSNIIDLPFNDKVYSTGHPALSNDNKKLYFVSDREGGYGKTDIYEVDILANGEYSSPKNLGENINTSGREMFPFIASDNTLYFSSDDIISIGLLDIFKSNILNNSNARPENLGAPYNSGYDDFAFFVNSEQQKGFFSSNRPGGKGNDDIYAFDAYQCTQTIKGVAKDSKTDQIIADATVQLIDETGKIIKTTTTSATGEYSFENVSCDKSYTLLAKKEDYKDDIQKLTTSSDHNKENIVNFNLIPLFDPCEIVINKILFDFNKSNIRPDSKVELEYIVDVLKNHPEIIIKIEAHTDSRGTDRYNLKLSNKRAIATRDYLISRDVPSERIQSAIGYGETQLVNECNNDNRFKCSEEKHQENRRSHFYIVDCEQLKK